MKRKQKPLVFEGRVKFHSEDGGAALIANLDCTKPGDDAGMFLRLQSWDNRACSSDKAVQNMAHPDAKTLSGKRVRLVLTVI